MKKYTYSTGGNCPGQGQGPMGGAPGSYIRMGKSGNPGVAKKGKSVRNHPGEGASKQGTHIIGGRKGYVGHSGTMRLGNND